MCHGVFLKVYLESDGLSPRGYSNSSLDGPCANIGGSGIRMLVVLHYHATQI